MSTGINDLILLTNVALTSETVAFKQVYEDWRLRSRIEHGYRFDQEQGLDVEDMRVETLGARCGACSCWCC